MENIHFNAPVDVPVPYAPPVGKRLSIEFFMAPQRTSTAKADPPLLIKRVNIGRDGKVQVELPADVPLFEVLRRPDETVPVGRDGQIFHVGGMNFNRSDQTGRCVGCHAGHSMLKVPDDASWTNLAPSATVDASSFLVPAIDSPVLLPQALVDRRTDVPIRAREAVIYGPAKVEDRPEQVISSFSLTTFLGKQAQEEIAAATRILPEGTRVALTPEKEFDALVIGIKASDVSGTFFGFKVPSLAEIEVIAQAADTTLKIASGLARGAFNFRENQLGQDRLPSLP